MKTNSLDSIKYAQKERLEYIDFSLAFYGLVTRTELVKAFEYGLANGTRDLALYKELAFENMQLEQSSKKYYRTNKFKAIFEHSSIQALQSFSLGNIPQELSHVTSININDVKCHQPNIEILSVITRAICLKRSIKAKYVSLTSGETEKELLPHSLINDGHRWHARAYDKATKSFKDFNINRFVSALIQSNEIKKSEMADSDAEWNNMLDIELIVHPKIQHKKAIELEYNMQQGSLKLKVKSALLGYLLNQWRVDCSTDHSLSENKFHLALNNINNLNGAKNIVLAPGYKIENEGLI